MLGVPVTLEKKTLRREHTITKKKPVRTAHLYC